MSEVRALRARAKAKPAAAAIIVPCPRNEDCDRKAADSLARLADHFDNLFGPPGAEAEDRGEAMKALSNIGEVAGKWLRFCAFTRVWFPRVGWWLLPIVVTLLSKGTAAGWDAFVAALNALPGVAGGG